MAANEDRNGNRPARKTKARPSDSGVEWAHPLLGKWAAWQRAKRLSRETIRIQGPTVNNFAKEICCDPVSACPDDIIEWFERHPEWSIATAAAYWSALKAWFKWLEKAGHRKGNPMTTLESPRRPTNTPRPISDEDLRRLLSIPHQTRTRTMILLAALAGLRVSEIARIKGEDVDLSGQLIYVRGKGGAIKTVPLHPMLVTTAAQMPTTGYWFPGRESFGGAQDKTRSVTSATVTQTITRAMRRAGVRGTPHALRHWFATASLRASGDLRAVQLLMRHASVTSTQIYTEIADDRRAEVVNMLDPFAVTRRKFQETKGQDDE